MSEANFWQLVAFGLVDLVFFIFMVLDGFDMGIGMVLPFISKKDADKKLLLDIVWPFWDGNELWAVIGGGLIFAAFPAAFSALLGGLAPWVAGMLVFIMYRAIAFESWYKDPKRRRLWEFAFAIGSLLLSFGFGALVGNLFAGLPLGPKGEWQGDLLTPFRPLPILLGCLLTAASVYHGATYLRKKTEGELRDRATTIARRSWYAYALLGLASTLALVLAVPGILGKPLFLIGTAVAAVAIGLGPLFLRATNDDHPFHASAAALAGMWVAAGAALWPWLSLPTSFSAGLSVVDAASPESTLSFISIFMIVAIAIVAGYSAFVFRVFKGKGDQGGGGY
jgi:cytochrome d ubiquinol oxidase subunit II